MTEETYCKRHPDTATRLTCGNCGDAICPQCMVHAGVGVRCPDCGKAATLPTFQVSGLYLVRAVLAAVTVGAVTGFIYGFYLAEWPFLGIILIGIGYLVAEAATLAADRRRGRTMQYVVAGGILVALVLIFLLSVTISVWTLIGAVGAILVGTGRVR